MKETKLVRIFEEDVDKLHTIGNIRFANRNQTKEKRFPTPGKILNLILRNPKIVEIIKKDLYQLPAREDLTNEV